MLSALRQAMYTAGAGLPTGMASLQDLGISTGASTGTASASAVEGLLTVNTGQLTAAIQSNPSGVQAVLRRGRRSSRRPSTPEASPFGAIETRIQGNTTHDHATSRASCRPDRRCSTTRRRNMEAAVGAG